MQNVRGKIKKHKKTLDSWYLIIYYAIFISKTWFFECLAVVCYPGPWNDLKQIWYVEINKAFFNFPVTQNYHNSKPWSTCHKKHTKLWLSQNQWLWFRSYFPLLYPLTTQTNVLATTSPKMPVLQISLKKQKNRSWYKRRKFPKSALLI